MNIILQLTITTDLVMFFGMGQLGYISTINGGMPPNPHPFSAFVLRPTQDEGFSFFSGMLRLQHLLRCALRTFSFCNLLGVRVYHIR